MPSRSSKRIKPARLALALGLSMLSGAVVGLALSRQAPVAFAEAALLLFTQVLLARHLLRGVAVALCRSCGAESPDRLPDGSCIRCGDRRPAALPGPRA